MILDRRENIRFHLFETLAGQADVSHFVSSRTGGQSPAPYDSLNLGFHVGDDPGNVLKNRMEVARILEASAEDFTFSRQVHGNTVSVVKEDMRGAGWRDHGTSVRECDGLVTDVPGIWLLVLVADCVPVLLYDPERRVAGAIHAGWRGTVEGMATNAVQTMKEAFGCRPADILAGVGPSIGPCCYQVGGEVADRFDEMREDTEVSPVLRARSSCRLDLREANRRQLLKAGIVPEHIESAGICTACRSEEFFSHRASGGRTGRFAAGIVLRRER